jgi:hypothetical protein
MVKYCPRCGFQNPDEAMYCSRCGFPLTQPVYQPTVQQPPVSPPPYPQPPSAGGKKRGRKLVPIIGVALAIIVIIAALFLVPPLFHHTTPNQIYVYSSLLKTLGRNFSVITINGSNANGYLALGTLSDNKLFVNYSYLYYIENGNGSIVLYQPGDRAYWGNLPYNIGVLRLMPPVGSSSAVLINTTGLTYTGGNYTVIFIGTYTQGSSPPGDGYTVFLFVTPPKPPVNMTTNDAVQLIGIGTPISGWIYYPYSSTPYIAVEWDYAWGPWFHPAPAQFNIWVVHPYPNGTITVNNITILARGAGSGLINSLAPGDLIEMEVTYDGYSNTIYAKVVNLNTSDSINITLPLYNNFTVPKTMGYWTEINSGGGVLYANWGILYLAVLNNVYVNIVPKSG